MSIILAFNEKRFIAIYFGSSYVKTSQVIVAS